MEVLHSVRFVLGVYLDGGITSVRFVLDVYLHQQHIQHKAYGM